MEFTSKLLLKREKSIIWSRDKLKARQPGIDPVCASVCGIQQITWGRGSLAERAEEGERRKGRGKQEGQQRGRRENKKRWR